MNSRGFTLIEVLIAVVILSLITLLVWQSMGSMNASRERSQKKDEVFRGATVALSRLSRDLSMAVLFSKPEFLGLSAGGQQATKSVLIGTNSGDQDKLTFMSFSHIRYQKNVKESDLAEITYFLEKDDEGGLESYILKKREASPPDDQPEEGGNTVALLTGVKQLNFRYYDVTKAEYRDDWDTTKVDYLNRLPRAVEITLVLQDPIDEEATVRFSTVALLEMAPGPNDF